MLGASVTDPSWLDQVPADRPTMVVAEGLTMYLDPADGHALFRRVVERFPSGEVFVDAYSKFGIKAQKTNAIVRGRRPPCVGVSTSRGNWRRTG